MLEMVARCGNRCDLCPLFKDNFSPDHAEAVNNLLFKYHHGGEGPRPHYTRGCDGCLSDGYVAREGCEIRHCATTRRISTCADCRNLFCSILESDMAVIEGALTRFGSSLSQDDYERYFRPFMIRNRLTALRSSRVGR